MALSYLDENFIVRSAAGSEAVPLKLAKPSPRWFTSFRRNDRYAVWDERGLSVRSGQWLHSTRLSEAAVSRKIFDRDEILETVALVKAGKRSREASSLSGAVRIGREVFMLVRWDDADKQPWLEALFRIDLEAAKPKPLLVGRFAGLSKAEGNLDDQMFIRDGKLAIVAAQKAVWGLATYEAKAGFEFRPMGDVLLEYSRTSPRLGMFTEKTGYGTTVIGRVDWTTGVRRNVAESRGRLRFVDEGEPAVVVESYLNRTRLINIETGAFRWLPASVALRRGKSGLVVWTPFDKPQRAWLYNPERWDQMAYWPGPPRSER